MGLDNYVSPVPCIAWKIAKVKNNKIMCSEIDCPFKKLRHTWAVVPHRPCSIRGKKYYWIVKDVSSLFGCYVSLYSNLRRVDLEDLLIYIEGVLPKNIFPPEGERPATFIYEEVQYRIPYPANIRVLDVLEDVFLEQQKPKKFSWKTYAEILGKMFNDEYFDEEDAKALIELYAFLKILLEWRQGWDGELIAFW
ncbi:MAG: hypothetical protein Q6363_008025 [Candidatus Njordarchaeota archaeon]